jgi:hypothetical protein
MPMSDEHKAALAQGRRESRAIKAYLEALKSRRPGRPITADSVRKRIESIDERLAAEDDPLKQLELRQEKIDAESTLKEVESKEDIDELEGGFIDAAKPYSERKGISYTAWRQVGVPARVLKEAGIPRTRQT